MALSTDFSFVHCGLQMMSTADFYMPETGPEKTERVRMGGRLTFPFSDGR